MEVYIDKSSSLMSALSKMDEVNKKLLIVKDGEKYFSLISIGDIQRAILKGLDINTTIEKILRADVFVGKTSDNKDELVKVLLADRVDFIPIINDANEIEEVLFWEDYSKEELFISDKLKNIPVVIMAGGFGTRLRPLTNIIPKPLVPLGEKPIIQIIIERFMAFGVSDFYISVNYKAEMIEAYLIEQNLGVNIEYFKEDEPLGTAGSLSLLEGKLDGDFFVSNCDILIDQDYGTVLSYHRENNNLLTAIAALKEIKIPYGVLNTTVNGKLVGMEEKPSYKHQINAGIYVLNASVLEYIPKNKFYNITEVMENLIGSNDAGVFPVSEGAWMDIGEWKEYDKTQKNYNSRFK